VQGNPCKPVNFLGNLYSRVCTDEAIFLLALAGFDSHGLAFGGIRGWQMRASGPDAVQRDMSPVIGVIGVHKNLMGLRGSYGARNQVHVR